MTDTNPLSLTNYCHTLVPAYLREHCGVDQTAADAIGRDIFARAEAFAALDHGMRRTLSAPFLEEVVTYQPEEASLELKAAVTVVVRNSLLETAHSSGALKAGGVKALTTHGAMVLARLLTDERAPESSDHADLFTDLPTRYPRAWAALAAIADAVGGGGGGGGGGSGGRHAYRMPDAPIPPMPAIDDAVDVKRSKDHDSGVIQSAIDPNLNRHLVEGITRVIEAEVPIYVTSLSRFSRNMDRLLYLIELLLAHDIPIVTTNYLIRSGDVWVRKGRLLQPDSYSTSGLDDLTGLSGSHRKIVEGLLAGMQ